MRNDGLDTLKGISIIGVVIIHVTAQLIVDVLNGKCYAPLDINVFILLSYLTRYCVPIFIMVTGYLYWNKNINTSFKKNINRLYPIILIYLLWSMIYTLPINSIQSGQINYFELFVLGKSAPPMYYIPLIYIPVIICVSLLKKLYYSPITLILGIITFGAIQYFDLLEKTFFHDIGFIIVYALVGCLFNYFDITKRPTKVLLYIAIGIAGSLYLIDLLLYIFNNGIIALQDKYGYYQLPTLLFSISLFGIFFATKKSFKFLSYLGQNSTIIFLAHWLFYVILYGVWLKISVAKGSCLFYLEYLLMIFLVTYLPVYFNSKTKSKI
jgi:surface polysaccharide O-acyltransferase-like enzyme